MMEEPFIFLKVVFTVLLCLAKLRLLRTLDDLYVMLFYRQLENSDLIQLNNNYLLQWNN
ncbi:292L [Invertebrate iridescent virus Kaz2018]|uniref:292L n=1 Tax=Invertebrate iridescent virus 6 TaxID=176652 RepID=Q91FN2_IIV6|nr:292L [Invertebrate iridescent virus 6]AAK82153.1 292L [Invertebrate iridescent virus 6]QMS79741.1 hypothetical protein IIV6-T1_286 [Invertebrate iridescent virus 6]QNH08702.1 292L [Invertebrate iridescent virus Kaz2018]